MTEVATARFILGLAVDDDGLSAEDGRVLEMEESLSPEQVTCLRRVLRDHFVSPEERAKLRSHGLFTRPFVTALAGRDGMEPLRRRVDLLAARAGDRSLPENFRVEALAAIRELYLSPDASPARENFLRHAVGRILPGALSLVRDETEAPLARESGLRLLRSLAARSLPHSYLNRMQALEVMEAFHEALQARDRHVRYAAFAHATVFEVLPWDLPEGDSPQREAWETQCRSSYSEFLTFAASDPDPNIHEPASALLSGLRP